MKWLLVLLLQTAPAAGPVETEPVLARTKVPATGEQESRLTVPRFGRYAITVSTREGAALKLVDRMAGPGEVAGIAGQKDGRLDVLLDRGEYLVKVLAHEKGTGDARLEVKRFTERATAPQLLVELKPVHAALSDFEQVSYWLEVKERRPVILEAAGRNLADLRLWRDGSWLVEGEPAREVVQPKTGKPILVFRLATILEPGLYLLSAYGGVSQPWSEDSGEHPFDLRWGIPTLGEAGRRRNTVSAFGTDRFLVPKNATFFRLELPEAKPASLQVSPFDPEKPFEGRGSSATVAKNSLPPVAEITVNARKDGYHLVTVTAEGDQPYVLQHFELRSVYTFERDGRYWLSTIHSGHPADSVDATSIVFEWAKIKTAAVGGSRSSTRR